MLLLRIECPICAMGPVNCNCNGHRDMYNEWQMTVGLQKFVCSFPIPWQESEFSFSPNWKFGCKITPRIESFLKRTRASERYSFNILLIEVKERYYEYNSGQVCFDPDDIIEKVVIN